jgi:hypothetical protein
MSKRDAICKNSPIINISNNIYILFEVCILYGDNIHANDIQNFLNWNSLVIIIKSENTSSHDVTQLNYLVVDEDNTLCIIHIINDSDTYITIY